MGPDRNDVAVKGESETTIALPEPCGNNGIDTDMFRALLLAWYDRHRRSLPWRALPGDAVDPYRVWLSEVMLQQTTVGAVIPYFLAFTERWPTVMDLARARDADVMAAWAGLGYYSRARNLLKGARHVVDTLDGCFPTDLNLLRTVPGVGDYTAAAIRSIAFDLPATVVDGNVERVIARYFAIPDPLPNARKLIRMAADRLSLDREDRPGDFAQAMMDLGATICTPRQPKCFICPLRQSCTARVQGIQNELPRRAPKQVKPRRNGYVYWITNDRGDVLIHRRPPKGLLGGMIGLPTSDWTAVDGEGPAHLPMILNPAIVEGEVRHVFTHFELKLQLATGSWSEVVGSEEYEWVAMDKISVLGLPTLFKKAAAMLARLG